MGYVSAQIFMRFAFKQCINNYQIHFWTINAVLITFEAKKPINLISKSGCSILHALKINKKYSEITTTASGFYTDVNVLYKPNIFQSRYFLIKIDDISKNDIFTCSCGASVEMDCSAVVQVHRVCYTVVSDTALNYLCNHTRSSCIPFGCKGEQFPN